MLYREAARIIDLVQNKQGTIKSLIHSSGYPNVRQLYALVCETLKYSDVIDEILTVARFLEREKWLSRSLAKVLLYDMLFGRGIQCGGKLRLACKSHKSALNAALARVKIKKGVVHHKDLLPEPAQDEVSLPRYVRVNTLKRSVQEVIGQFVSEGQECILTREEARRRTEAAQDADDVSRLFTDYVTALKPGQFMCDTHLEELLVFPPATDFHDHPLYKEGAIVLQDKASCLPAFILAPTPGSHVIDACAAPGNKTSHLAAIMQNTGKVFAFDADAKRVRTLNKLTRRSGASNVEICHQDFLTVKPGDQTFARVRHILLDPSCSGSGIVSRLDHLTNKDDGDGRTESVERLAALARVQTRLLSHALSFPGVERVVYSTCSVHRTENEGVVADALAANPDFELHPACPRWKNRGTSLIAGKASSSQPTSDETAPGMSACLRALPKDDRTNGFFVALFQRRGTSVIAESTKGSCGDQRGAAKPERKRCPSIKEDVCGDDYISDQTLVAAGRDSSDDRSHSVDHVDHAPVQRSKKRKRRRKGTAEAGDPETGPEGLTREAQSLRSTRNSCGDSGAGAGRTRERNGDAPTRKKRKRKRAAAKKPVTL